MQKQIQKYFDQAKDTYKQEARIQKIVAKECLELLNRNDFGWILEIGAGGGLLTEAAKSRLKSRYYVAVDLSLAMLKGIQERDVVQIQADGERLPFKPGSFDLLLSSSTMQWYQKGVQSIAENLTYLKKNGQFALAFFVRGTFKELAYASEVTGFGSVYPLAQAKTYIDFFSRLNINFDTCKKTYTIYYPSVRDFLQSHKKTGARYTRQKKALSKKRYLDFCKIYTRTFGEEGKIPVTYVVLYLWGGV
ncbi:methyltransferase domain-containing protein [Desulfohalobiaceae bacterium Ax17]|uniref:methyltransferase domain-containing protein n=1 Tax=Desulfovulcanus ferrireducens TaxID=2831190 RepID=UPI00207BAE75|nr:methyltransferase domain-containing protein [Desulfovulcanus ferrireducens]MBT8763532.1 methyltransferase domain-containing protein [Desulfovulcanus ferrireducens]